MRESEHCAIEALRRSATGLMQRGASPTRVARIAAIVSLSGLDSDAPVVEHLLSTQQSDGGWASVEETLWCLDALGRAGTCSHAVAGALEWMQVQRAPDGGWTRAPRETPNYVLSALVVSRNPTLASETDLRWIADSWRRHLREDVRLTYKAALYLESARHSNRPDAETLEATAAYLGTEQNSDGGFGPWRDHPIGSDPWSTGLCLVGMCAFPDLVDRQSVQSAVRWLEQTQLPSGYWPYHFIDEGTAYAYWGLSEALKYLEAQ